MFTDIVFPSNNEDKFIAMAQILGYKSICFAYNFDKNNINKSLDLIKNKQESAKLKIYTAILANFNKISRAKKLVELVLVQNSEKNREVLEKSEASVLFELESQNKRDFMHHRASGLNHILCSLANKNRKIIGFSFNSILNSKYKAQTLGRISQNIRLCRKYKVKTLIGSFAQTPFEMRSPYDLISLFVVLGMHPKDAKDSISMNLSNSLNENKL